MKRENTNNRKSIEYKNKVVSILFKLSLNKITQKQESLVENINIMNICDLQVIIERRKKNKDRNMFYQ